MLIIVFHQFSAEVADNPIILQTRLQVFLPRYHIDQLSDPLDKVRDTYKRYLCSERVSSSVRRPRLVDIDIMALYGAIKPVDILPDEMIKVISLKFTLEGSEFQCYVEVDG